MRDCRFRRQGWQAVGREIADLGVGGEATRKMSRLAGCEVRDCTFRRQGWQAVGREIADLGVGGKAPRLFLIGMLWGEGLQIRRVNELMKPPSVGFCSLIAL